MNDQLSVINATTAKPDLIPPDDASYIWLPFAVLLAVLMLSALVYLMARNRREFSHLYCKRKHAYAYSQIDEDSDVSIAHGNDEYGEGSATECLLKGKLQISNRQDNYQSTQVTPLADDSANCNSVNNRSLLT